MKIRRDKYGLYIRPREYEIDRSAPAYRPGDFPAYSHAMVTSDAGLAEGDNPKSRHVSGHPLVRITLPDGGLAYWGCYGRAEGDFPETN